jgi:orotate phosphoribosyltransferase
MTDPPTDQTSALIRLLKERSVQFGDFTLSSGRRSHYYVDARRTTMSAAGAKLIGELGLAAIRTCGWVAEAVGGLTLGADPVAYAIARTSLDRPPVLDAFTVRKTAKQHGTGRVIEGCFRPGASVVVIEDAVTTGSSALQAVSAVREAGGSVVGVLAVVDREEGGRENLLAAGVPVHCLVSIRDLVATNGMPGSRA